jgi:DNA-binding transcriptional ArsR family regulator
MTGDRPAPDARPTPGALSYRRLRDPRELSALAHPVRIGIMELLTVSGPLTATELADLLDESPANCSWHLRKLAEHHFVEEAGGGIGRQRPWRVTQVGLAWDEEGASPAEVRAGRALEQMLLERQVTRFHQARARLHDDGDTDWGEASTATQAASWLTLDELDEVHSEIRAVLERYVDRITDPAKRPAGSRLCEFVAWGAPLLLPGVVPVPDAVTGTPAVAGADAS